RRASALPGVFRVLPCRSPLPRRAGHAASIAAAVPLRKIMVNQVFNLFRGSAWPGRNLRQVLVTRQFFPGAKAIVNHSGPSFAARAVARSKRTVARRGRNEWQRRRRRKKKRKRPKRKAPRAKAKPRRRRVF